MRPPTDEFARFLRGIRKERRMGSVALSKAIGRSRTYIGIWERDATVIPKREALFRVADALAMSATQRKTLLQLADGRAAPNGAKDSYAITADPDANLFEALHDIDHDWPAEPDRPNPQSERAQPLIDATAWVLAEIAALETEILPPFSGIRWPEPLRRLGIVPDVDSGDAVEPPPELIREELPFVDQLTESLTPMDAYTQSIGMARVYRRMLFSNLDATRELVSVLERWEYDRSQALHDSLSLIFQSRMIDQVYGFRDVNYPIVLDLAERSLALVLWSGGQTRRKPIPWWSDYGAASAHTLWALANPSSQPNYLMGEDVRAALLFVRSRVWPYDASAVCHRFGCDKDKVAEVEAQLRKGELDDETRELLRTNAWLLAGVDQQVVMAYAGTVSARVPAPDAFALWTPGTPFPEGHPIWKPGETTLTPRDGVETPTAKPETKGRKPAVKKRRKHKAAAKKKMTRTKSVKKKRKA